MGLSRHTTQLLSASLAVVPLLVGIQSAHASGFAVARFGGPLGNPVSVNPAAVYYNPANLALINRTQVMIDVNWAYRTASYERDPGSLDRLPGSTSAPSDPDSLAANTGRGTVSNLIYSPMFGVATDFNTDLPFAVGLGFSAPFGGQAVWDQTDPVAAYPGAVDGPQRWYTIEGSIRTLALSLGAAYEIRPARLSIGLSGNLYLSEVNTIRARNVNGTDNLRTEGRSLIDVSSTDLGLGVGLTWEAIEDRLWLSGSWQSAPNLNGRMEFEGTLSNHFPPERDDNDVVLTQRLPDITRLGARFSVNEALELRLFGDIQRWSVFDNQCIIDQNILGDADPFEYCRVDENGDPPDGSSIVQNLARGWKNGFGVRAGGSWFASERVEVMFDLGYDSNAIPDESLEPALIDMNKVSVGVGGMFQLARSNDFRMRLGTTATNIFYFERDTTGVPTANRFLTTNSRQPSSAGIYNQNVFVLNTGLYFDF
jgi:long-chain fatty acid transport protein